MTSYLQFAEKHGGNPVPVDNKGTYLRSRSRIDHKGRLIGAPDVAAWLFADGAVYQQPDEPVYLEQYHEPPADAVTNHKIRRDYAQARVQMAEEAFVELQEALLYQGSAMPPWNAAEYGEQPYDVDGTAALKQLQRCVLERRDALAAIDNEPLAVEKRRAREESERLGQAAQQRAATADLERRSRISAISI